MKNKTYIGYIKFDGQYYRGDHEAFIDPELFDTVQDMIQRKYEEHAGFNRRLGKANSYLGGYLECSCCHAKYAKNTQMSYYKGKKYAYEYYQCNSRVKKKQELVKDPNCKNKNWRMDDLDALVFDEIRKLAVDPNYIAEIADNVPADERPDIINAEIKKLDDQMAKLMDLYVMQEMPMELLQERIHGLNEQKHSLEDELERINKENEDKLSLTETMEIAGDFSAILERGDFDEIREAIGSLIEMIEINGDDVTIHWNFV